MKHRHEARTWNTDMEQGHEARTCGLDMPHEHATWTYLKWKFYKILYLWRTMFFSPKTIIKLVFMEDFRRISSHQINRHHRQCCTKPIGGILYHMYNRPRGVALCSGKLIQKTASLLSSVQVLNCFLIVDDSWTKIKMTVGHHILKGQSHQIFDYFRFLLRRSCDIFNFKRMFPWKHLQLLRFPKSRLYSHIRFPLSC
jgi:hypothetical protein